MIIDAVIFNNENDMLDFRISILSPVVDRFIVVEADHTFSGKPKPYNFDAKRFKGKNILYHKVKIDASDLKLDKPPKVYDPSHDCWKIEYRQRDAIKDAIGTFKDEDIIIWGDADEIPSREAVKAAGKHHANLPLVYDQAFFYYNLKHWRQEAWRGSIFCTVKMLREKGGQTVRDQRNKMAWIIKPGGWHLSYFGVADKIAQKIEAFSHQELNTPEFKDKSHIAECISTGRDLFKRQTSVKAVPRNFFPPYFVELAPKEWWNDTLPNT